MNRARLIRTKIGMLVVSFGFFGYCVYLMLLVASIPGMGAPQVIAGAIPAMLALYAVKLAFSLPIPPKKLE